jgi:hypothetical protein
MIGDRPFIRSRCMVVAALLAGALLGGTRAFAAASTPAPAATKSTTSSTCGDQLLEAEETCESCPRDCKAALCTTGTERRSYLVDLSVPPARFPNAVILRIGYRTSVLSLPGRGKGESIRARVHPEVQAMVFSAEDLDHAVRVVLAKGGELEGRTLVRVEFDRCKSTPDPTPRDLSCLVEGCAGGAGPIDGCTCALRAAPE